MGVKYSRICLCLLRGRVIVFISTILLFTAILGLLLRELVVECGIACSRSAMVGVVIIVDGEKAVCEIRRSADGVLLGSSSVSES